MPTGRCVYEEKWNIKPALGLTDNAVEFKRRGNGGVAQVVRAAES